MPMFKLDAYLRSLVLSVRKKLCFFCEIIGLSCNFFLSWYASDAGFSDMYTESWKQHLLCSVKTLFWGGVGEVSAN